MPKTVITATTVAKAKADAQPGGPRYDIVDGRVQGLSLRVSPRGVQWSWRFQINGQDKRLALGGVDLWTIAEARSLVDRGQEMLRGRMGIPDEAWLDRMKLDRGKTAEVTLQRIPDPRPSELFVWTFAQARARFIAEKRRTKRRSTATDYENKLQAPELFKLDKLPVSRITLNDLAGIVAGIHRSGRERTAELTAAILSSMWTWLGKPENADKTGVARGAMLGLAAPERTRRPSKRRVHDPTLEDLGRIVAIARSGAVSVLVGAAVELLVWSLQRRAAVVAIKLEDLRPIGDGTEGLWYVYADDRKRDDGEAHVVPLPAPAWAAVQRAIKVLEQDYWRRLDADPSAPRPEYLFPGKRPRRLGMGVTHMNPSTLTHILRHMPGVTSSPHHIRHIFGTYGERMLGFSRPTTRIILDHSEGGTRSDVTGKHYSLHDGTHEKWPVMRKWVAALQPEVDAALANLEPVAQIKAEIAASRKADDRGRAAAE